MVVDQYNQTKEVLSMSIYNDKTIFNKLTHVIDGNFMNGIVKKYNSDFRSQHFDTRSHIYSMLYLQLSETKSLRGLIDKLNSNPKLQSSINVPSVSQLSRKNASRDYRVFEDLYFHLVHIAKRKLAFNEMNKYFREIKAFDSTVIQIAASLAPNLKYENNKSGMKISTLYNVSKGLPEKVHIVPAKVNDRKCITEFVSDQNVLYLFDRGYFDYKWYDELTDNGFKFITRQVSNASVEEVRSTYVDNDFVFDSEVTLGTNYSNNKTHNSYREILTFNEEQEEVRLLTNIFNIPAEEIINLYRLRWKIEIFFKWIKQNLRIKQWLGFNINAIKIQVYSALIAYLLLALLKIDLDAKLSMLSFTRIILVNLLENVDILSRLSG